eukprot:TRINITY_DN3507_c0_g1_i1.p1 TRINITY_DN3507_c0_g1~~TRINITY_DN3507_c0_g1_i1.p1  ORF type:complete len:594 (+),score=125.60 TRINITY_DN3507_c0_g1_i1:60-1841(+)
MPRNKKRTKPPKKSIQEPESYTLSVETQVYKISDAVLNDRREHMIPKGGDIVRIRGLNLLIGDLQLLQDAELCFLSGHRYGLIGRNGVGKSSLMRYMVFRKIPRFPEHLRVYLMEEGGGYIDGLTAQQVVLKSDTAREYYIRTEQELLDAEEIDNDALNQLYEDFANMDLDADNDRALDILKSLGFTQQYLELPTNQLSGGWKMRVSLASALFIKPDILMLDEPTNHLDLDAIIWLQTYLKTYKGTVIVVSHDRTFLNEVCTDIVHFKDLKLNYFPGDYSSWLLHEQEAYQTQLNLYDQQERTRKRYQDTMQKARESNNNLGVVKSRQRRLNRLGAPKTEAGKKWKWGIMGERRIMTMPTNEREVRFQFICDDPIGSGAIVKAKNISFAYNDDDRNIIENVEMTIYGNSRIGILGANGSGKTTLLDVFTRKLQISEGELEFHPNVRIGYFSQYHVQQLNIDISPLEHMMNKHPGTRVLTMRSHLGKFGIGGDKALMPIISLSGGERSRVVLADIFYDEPHLVVLDEPTNYLDLYTIEGLTEELMEYPGAVLFVSHDQMFIEEMVQELWVVDNSKVSRYDGGFLEYQQSLVHSV